MMKLIKGDFLATLLLGAFIFPITVIAQRTSKVVARFAEYGASASIPIQNKNVNIVIGGTTYSRKTNKKGWLVITVPCGKQSQLKFGDEQQYNFSMKVPCQRTPVGFGLFDWRNGSFISNDMDFVDGCRICD